MCFVAESQCLERGGGDVEFFLCDMLSLFVVKARELFRSRAPISMQGVGVWIFNMM